MYVMSPLVHVTMMPATQRQFPVERGEG